jgi:hypothetical protein
MKTGSNLGLKCVALAVVAGAVYLAGCATAEQNMAEQRKLHLIPGKELHVYGPNYQFCEVGLFYGTTPDNAVAIFYNPTTGTEHCTPEQFAQIEKDKAQIIKDNGARDAWLNPTRYWTWDEMWIYEVGDQKQFGPVNMAYMGVVPVEVMKQAVGAGHYHPGQIARSNKYVYKKGTTVYLLDMPDGKVLLMQSWTAVTNKGETADNLKDLGSQFKQLPPGWKFRTNVLDRELTVEPPLPNKLAWVTQDEFNNTYEGCGYDAACNYTP